MCSGYQVPGFGCQVPGFGNEGSGFRAWRFRVSGIKVPGFGNEDPCSGYQNLGFGNEDPCSGYQDLGFGNIQRGREAGDDVPHGLLDHILNLGRHLPLPLLLLRIRVRVVQIVDLREPKFSVNNMSFHRVILSCRTL